MPTVLFSQTPTPHSRLANSLLWMARCQGEVEAAGLQEHLHFPWSRETFEDFLDPASPWLAAPGPGAELFARVSGTPLTAKTLATFCDQLYFQGVPSLVRLGFNGVIVVWGGGEGLPFGEALAAGAGADLLLLHEPFGFQYARPNFPTKTLGPVAPPRWRIDAMLQRQALRNPQALPSCGLHIRRGDYATWLDGKFFYPDSIWYDLCRQKLADGTQVNLFTNEPQGELCQALVGLGAHLCGGSAAEDLIAMMGMDQVIGPPSTFPVVASMLARFCLGRSLEVERLGPRDEVLAEFAAKREQPLSPPVFSPTVADGSASASSNTMSSAAADYTAGDFASKSKDLHKEYSQPYWAGAFDPDHPDTKRHYAMLASSVGLLDHLKPVSLLSVGDNLARDAGYFKRLFPQAWCIASDLHADGIHTAAQEGWVDAALAADIEALPFGDGEIDCVVAKESFHHWPRPMLGFYEMLRVARKAVLLIEPYDVMHSAATPLLQTHSFYDDYEEVGNYKYQISLREILKAAWSLYYPAVAAVGFNDPYAPERSVEEWLIEKGKLDALGDAGERQFNLMTIVVYKPGHAPAPEALPPRARLYRRPPNPFGEPGAPG